MSEKIRLVSCMMLISLAVWLNPILGPINIGIGFIVIGVLLLRERANTRSSGQGMAAPGKALERK